MADVSSRYKVLLLKEVTDARVQVDWVGVLVLKVGGGALGGLAGCRVWGLSGPFSMVQTPNKCFSGTPLVHGRLQKKLRKKSETDLGAEFPS